MTSFVLERIKEKEYTFKQLQDFQIVGSSYKRTIPSDNKPVVAEIALITAAFETAQQICVTQRKTKPINPFFIYFNLFFNALRIAASIFAQREIGTAYGNADIAEA